MVTNTRNLPERDFEAFLRLCKRFEIDTELEDYDSAKEKVLITMEMYSASFED